MFRFHSAVAVVTANIRVCQRLEEFVEISEQEEADRSALLPLPLFFADWGKKRKTPCFMSWSLSSRVWKGNPELQYSQGMKDWERRSERPLWDETLHSD